MTAMTKPLVIVLVVVSLLVAAGGITATVIAIDRATHRGSEIELLQGRLDDASGALEASISRQEQLRSKLDDTRATFKDTKQSLRLTQADLKEARGRIRDLTVSGAGLLSTLEAKAACLDVVLDAYNQYNYYEDIGMALERALGSQACQRGGVS